jgi:hypothetical protein
MTVYYIRHAVKYLMTHYLYLEAEYPPPLEAHLAATDVEANCRFLPVKNWQIFGQIF